MDKSLEIKELLFEYCHQHIDNRFKTIKEALDNLRESAAGETKSSMGDKYETGRAMIQIEVENLMSQREEVGRLQQQLDRLPKPDKKSDSVQPGSLVHTNHGQFYLAISIGKVNIEGEVFFIITPGSPIGVKLRGLKVDDQLELNGRTYAINKII